MAKIALVSLGCEKNLVNSEQMLYKLQRAGHETVPAEEAEIGIVNTCGFIESAKSEAIETILSLAQPREGGPRLKIIVTGCLAQRYPEEILKELPEVDGIVGCGSFDEIEKAVASVENGERPRLMGDINAEIPEEERCVTTPRHYSYIKIAEGCDNRCAYCVIPYLRGRYRSRKMEDIVEEARALAASGTKELIVIAQDVTRYGRDIYGKGALITLLKELCKVEGIVWIRLHYLYPDELTDELLELIASEEKIVKYFDIPIQHVNNAILKAMNRRGTKEELTGLLSKIRKMMPEAVIRTSIICGLPGEGEAEFEELSAFLREQRLEKAGFFVFSPEEGTPAAVMEGQIPKETAEQRSEALTLLQERIMDERFQSMKGKTLTVICDAEDEGAYVGRTYAESPGIDGVIRFTSSRSVKPGEFAAVTIEGVSEGEPFGIV